MKQNSWGVIVWNEFQRTLEEIKQKGVAVDARVSFWELGFNLSDDVLKTAAESIHNEISNGIHARQPLESCLVLFHLLRTRLTNVRGNHLWPEVCEGFSRLTGAEFHWEMTANYFRDAIRFVFNDNLEPVHNRYVMFCLDETGVGKDRSRIVADFLGKLLHRAEDEAWSDNDVEDGVTHLFREYLLSLPNKQDVKVLETVLCRTGLALVRLAADLRESGAAFMVTLWDWERIREYWFERSGVDLDRLIPEGRQIFSQMLNRIGNIISRQGIAKLATEEFKIDWPKGFGLGETIIDRNIPLCPIRLHHGSDTKVVHITDEFGLTAEKILLHDSRVWHGIGRHGAFCWKKAPFMTRTGLGRLEKSAPLIGGDSPETAFVQGHFWSGRLDYGTPFVDGVKMRATGAELTLQYEWMVDETGFTFMLGGFNLLFSNHSGSSTIMFDDLPLWSGGVKQGCAVITAVSINASTVPSIDETIRITMVDGNGQVLASKIVENPLAANANFVFEGRVVTDRKLVLNSWPRDGSLQIFVKSGLEKPKVKGSALQKAGEMHEGYDMFILVPESNKTDIVVNAGGSSWLICRRVPVTMKAGAYQCSITLSNVKVEGTNGVFPVASSDPITIEIIWPKDIPLLRLAEFKMEIRSDSACYRWFLPVLLKGFDIKSDSVYQRATIDILPWLNDHGIEFPEGLITLSIGSAMPKQQVSFYRIGCVVMDDATRAGEIAGLTLKGAAGNIRVESDQPVSFEDAMENKILKATLPVSPGLEISFCWQPCYEDACIFYRQKCVPEGTSLDMNVLKESTLRGFSGTGAEWIILLDGIPVTKKADLYLELGSFVFEHEFKSPPLKRTLEVRCGEDHTKTWFLSMTPSDINVIHKWQSRYEISIEVTWFGLPVHQLEFMLMGEGTPVSPLVKSKKYALGKPAAMNFSGVLEIFGDVVQVADSLNIYCLGKKLGSIMLDRPGSEMDIVPGPREIKNAIRQLFTRMTGNSNEEDRMLEQLVRLMELYMRETGKLPFPVDALIDRVNRHGSPKTRDHVAFVLYLMEQLANPVPVPFEVPKVMEGGYLGAVLLTLHVALETRLSLTGEAKPSVLVNLAKVFSGWADDAEGNDYAVWSAVLSDFCRYQASVLRGDVERGPLRSSMEDRRKAFDDPVVGFDININKWLEKSLNDERGTCDR